MYVVPVDTYILVVHHIQFYVDRCMESCAANAPEAAESRWCHQKCTSCWCPSPRMRWRSSGEDRHTCSGCFCQLRASVLSVERRSARERDHRSAWSQPARSSEGVWRGVPLLSLTDDDSRADSDAPCAFLRPTPRTSATRPPRSLDVPRLRDRRSVSGHRAPKHQAPLTDPAPPSMTGALLCPSLALSSTTQAIRLAGHGCPGRRLLRRGGCHGRR